MIESLSYAIDDQDRLIRLDDGYYGFAAENGWPNPEESFGRVLWDYVEGEELRKVQRIVLRRIRDEVREIELPVRCDGPSVRREMQMRIVAHPSGRIVLFTARVRSEDERDEPVPVLDFSRPRGEETLEMCGWCDRFLVNGEWVEAEEATLRLQLFRRELPQIVHSICPRCRSLLLGD